MVYVAFYKGKKTIHTYNDWIKRFVDGCIRKFTRGQYSHCEVCISAESGQYRCFSSSWRDSGVRMKVMDLPAEKWEIIPVNFVKEEEVLAYFEKTKDSKYDILGALGVWRSQVKFFCSEWVFNCIGNMDSEGWRFNPNELYSVVCLVKSKLSMLDNK